MKTVLLVVLLALAGCHLISDTSAATKAELAALQAETLAKVEARLAAGDDPEIVYAEEIAALRKSIVDLAAQASASAVTEGSAGLLDAPVSGKAGGLALLLMWLLRNARYVAAGGWPALLLGALHKSAVHKP